MNHIYMTASPAEEQVVPMTEVGKLFPSPALTAIFWRPAYLESSPWMEYIPFAFWLTEAHRPGLFVELGTGYGTSYFAFCQAVDRLGISTRSFAVDKWKGDEYAESYDEEMFEKVNRYNHRQYASFSQFIRSSFDAALSHFTDGSIDLLHIHGSHTFDTVRHDFDSWLPKLSNRAVVILHNTNERLGNSGACKLFAQLQGEYPSFEFLHGQGLGVLGIGAEQSDQLKYLFRLNRNESAKRTIHEIFSRLGLACTDAFMSAQHLERGRQLDAELKKQTAQFEELKQSLEKAKSDLGGKSKELGDARTRIQTQIEHHAVERGHLAERATLLQEMREDLKREVAGLREELQKHRVTAELNQVRLTEQERELVKLREVTEAQARETSRLTENVANQSAEIDRLSEALINRERELRVQEAEGQRLSQETSALQVEKEELAHQLEEELKGAVKLTQLLETANQQRTALEQSHAQALKDVAAKVTAQEAQVARAAQDTAVVRAEKERLARKLEERFKEIAKLTQLLDVAEKSHTRPEQSDASSTAPRKWPFLRRLLANPGREIRSRRKLARQAQLLGESGLFDEAWYLARYGDVAQSKMDPVKHYLRFGAAEGRDPGPRFSTNNYLAAYPDVAAAHINPLVHYLQYGKKEGRIAQ